MEPQDILNETRQAISDHAGDDPDKWFYANRFVFARLQLDERKTKTHIKKQLLESSPVCYYCKQTFKVKTGIPLHRLDGSCGYSLQNCALMHGECHTQYHKENPTERSLERPSSQNIENAEAPILEKFSQRYEDKPFLYWWDISPGFIEKIDRYDAVEFVKKDSHERCYVPTAALKGYLIEERRTSRGTGNWGIKVIKDREDELAFEPATKKDKWLFLPVVWLLEKEDD